MTQETNNNEIFNSELRQKYLTLKGKEFDFTIIVNGKYFSAHQEVLSSSQYFTRMLNSDSAEARTKIVTISFHAITTNIM